MLEIPYTYSNKTLGNINYLDVNNTLRPILFFKENARIVVTDNTLSAQQNSYSLEDLDLYQAQLIATSLVDNGIWIYDQELFQLIKVNKEFERIYESGNLEQILQKDNLNPSQILEHKIWFIWFVLSRVFWCLIYMGRILKLFHY